MGGHANNEREILRNPALMIRLPFLVGFLVLLGFLQGDDHNDALIFWISAAFVLLMGLRPSLTTAPEGLIVSNVLARRYLWDEIVDIERHYGLTLRLRLKDGSHKDAWAVGSGQGRFGRDWIDRTNARVRERWLLETAGASGRADASAYLPPKRESF